MSAKVLPFPLARRRDLVVRQAAWFAEQNTGRAAESNLFHQLQVQRDTLLRRGVDPERIEGEVKSLERAIRAEVWRLVLTPEVGA